jgi:hypothetical protein
VSALTDFTSQNSDTSKATLSNEVSNVAEVAEVSGVGNCMYEILRQYVGASRDDLTLIILWVLHTRVFTQLATTPRLLISSILPGAGKSTVLDWIGHLAGNSTNMSAVSSAALLARLADTGKTLLIDEADRSLRKDNPLTADFLAIVNSGYKKGGTRPTLEPVKGGGWEPAELKTWCPVAFAGNNPDLPDDTRSRCVSVFLYPSDDMLDTDWELLEQDPRYKMALSLIDAWAGSAQVGTRPTLDSRIRGRMKEKWLPLARVAQTLDDLHDDGATFSWLHTVQRLALTDLDQQVEDAEMGLVNASPHVAILKDIARLWAQSWPDDEYKASSELCNALALADSDKWGAGSSFGKPITPKRLATMLKKTGVDATRLPDHSKRGYAFTAFKRAWESMHVWQSLAQEGVAEPSPDTSATSATLDTLKDTPILDVSENAPVKKPASSNPLPTYPNDVDWSTLPDSQLNDIIANREGLWPIKAKAEQERRMES